MDDPWYRISYRIRTERVRLGLSTTQLGRALDVSRTTIHNWESGKPIPIERCASIADALGIDQAELLALHPHSTYVRLDDDDPAPVSYGRLIKVGLTAMTLVIVGTMFFTWSTAKADCIEPGAGGGSLLGPFLEAHARYGGQTALGCAINEVHKWGPGYVQDFEGGTAERSVLMTLNRTDVYYLGGDLWWDYVNIADGATPDVAGVAATEALQCGTATVVLLGGGHGGPGALVLNASRDHHVWLPGDIWAPYREVGGPLGELGLPVGNDVTMDGGTVTAEFEGGTIVHVYGQGADIDPAVGGTAFQTEDCRSV